MTLQSLYCLNSWGLQLRTLPLQAPLPLWYPKVATPPALMFQPCHVCLPGFPQPQAITPACWFLDPNHMCSPYIDSPYMQPFTYFSSSPSFSICCCSCSPCFAILYPIHLLDKHIYPTFNTLPIVAHHINKHPWIIYHAHLSTSGCHPFSNFCMCQRHSTK